MYTQFFRLTQTPFSISPDPRYLFMSERHREALAHLLYGVNSGGGLVLLTGDIGTGKTTVCRCFLDQVPANCNVAYIFNPKLSVIELLQSICEEFHVEAQRDRRRTASAKDYIDALNSYLLTAHAEGRSNVLVIDEAQNLSADVLEQLRLLTNLETNERKLLQIILIGQPELRAMLARPELEQLAQRVVAQYHLTALSEQETATYIQHRLATAGLATVSPFQPPLIKQIHRLTLGVPRRINLLCDRALLGAYAKGTHDVDRKIVDKAAAELFVNQNAASARGRRRYAVLGLMAGVLIIGAVTWAMNNGSLFKTVNKSGALSASAKALRLASLGSASEPAKNAAVADQATEFASGQAQAAPHTVFSENNGISRAGLHNENGAILQLAQMWGLSLQDDDPCEAAKKTALRCHRSHGGFGDLRQLDRPAVLKLHDHANKTYYALLTGMTDTGAMLRAGSVNQAVSLVVLTRYFHGEFVTLWRAPPTFGDTVEMGDKGPEVDWIATQLAKLNGTETPEQNQPFSQKALKQVRRFQQVQGLFVDGVVGPVTVMHLNRLAGVVEPRLRYVAIAGE